MTMGMGPYHIHLILKTCMRRFVRNNGDIRNVFFWVKMDPRQRVKTKRSKNVLSFWVGSMAEEGAVVRRPTLRAEIQRQASS